MRTPVVYRDNRSRGAHPQQVCGYQQHRHRLRSGDRDVLRNHLAEKHVQHHDDGDRDQERHGVQQRIRDSEQTERLFEKVRHCRFADPAQQDRADRDPELGPGQHYRQVLAGPDHRHRAVLALLGEGLQPVTARRDQRELRCDEERVRAEQQHGEQHSEKVTHRRPPSSQARRAG
jgi:hypothetical protein